MGAGKVGTRSALKTRITPSAYADLRSIRDFISQDSPSSARKTIEIIAEIVDQCALQPLAGRIVPEYDNPKIRERIWGSYRIIYRLQVDILEVIAIYHASRDLRIMGTE